MNHELAYFLKVNIAIVLFYAFYRLFFYKDTFFQWRRTALLCFLGISFLYPLLNLQDWIKEQEPMLVMADFYSTVILPELTIEPGVESAGTNWKFLFTVALKYVYIGVVIALLARLLFQLLCIFRLAFSTSTQMLQQTKVHLLNNVQGPFSFFKWIFIHPGSHTKEEVNEILTHEQTHARQWHSIDVLISEFMCIFCWFNPFIWLLKREVRNNLEFLADHKVLETGHDCKTYQYHLLGLAYGKKTDTLYNSFNVLPLKIRIRMMNKKRTKRIERTKYLIFLPLAALLLIISNIEAIARSTEKVIDQIIQPKDTQPEITDIPVEVQEERVTTQTPVAAVVQERTAPETQPMSTPTPAPESVTIHMAEPEVPQEIADTENEEVVFEVVERMPEYPGGVSALMKYFQKNIKYPLTAQENGTQGRVIVQFVVDSIGNITHPTIVRNVSPELDIEVMRVVTSMPRWIPGRQRGKAVSVRYTVPVMFRLETEPEIASHP